MTVPSALGLHEKAARSLSLSPSHRRVCFGMNHFDLLDRRAVYDQIHDRLVSTTGLYPGVAPFSWTVDGFRPRRVIGTALRTALGTDSQAMNGCGADYTSLR